MLRGLIEHLGERTVAAFSWMGGVGLLFGRAMMLGPRRPIGTYDIAFQVVQQGMRSLPMASIMSLFIGMILAWQFGDALADFGAKTALGYATSLALVRELVPAVLAVTAGARISAGMAAELGSMKVTEQIDAVAALGADPLKKLVWPRVAGAAIGMPLLVIWGNLISLLGGMIISEFVFDVPSSYFYETYMDELVVRDYFMSLTKGLVFGTIVGTIGCFQGFNTGFGTAAVGQATTETVVYTSITIIVADFFLTMAFLPVV